MIITLNKVSVTPWANLLGKGMADKVNCHMVPWRMYWYRMKLIASDNWVFVHPLTFITGSNIHVLL